jgi:Fe-S cluster assembly iron-binding protein IscA
MVTLTEKARDQLRGAMAEGLFEGGRLRVFIDHRCHCGKAHFSLAIDDTTHPGDITFDVFEVPFLADAPTSAELPLVEIDFVETIWTRGFTVKNTSHQCGHTMVA